MDKQSANTPICHTVQKNCNTSLIRKVNENRKRICKHNTFDMGVIYRRSTYMVMNNFMS